MKGINLKPDVEGMVKTKHSGLLVAVLVLIIIVLASLIGVGALAWQNAVLSSRVSELETESKQALLDGWSGNPLFEEADYQFAMTKNFYTSEREVSLTVTNGRISKCTNILIGVTTLECNISNLDGEIYKMIEVSTGKGELQSSFLCFIMTDGRVLYLPVRQMMNSGVFSIEGELEVEKPVVDIVEVEIIPEVAFSARTGFLVVFNDGAFEEFTRAMVN